jgi:hypothetical protein
MVALRPDDPASWPKGLSRPVAELVRYWGSKCLDGRFPRRFEIVPAEIPAILPYLYIVERLSGEETDYLFRLVGTRIVEIEGECTGRRLSELFVDRARYASVWRQYDEACAGRIFVRRQDLGWKGKRHIDYETVLLPLFGDGEAAGPEVAFLIGVACATSLD